MEDIMGFIGSYLLQDIQCSLSNICVYSSFQTPYMTMITGCEMFVFFTSQNSMQITGKVNNSGFSPNRSNNAFFREFPSLPKYRY